MIQAQLDLQTQLEQTSSHLTTQPLNDSLVLFLDAIDQVHSHTSEQVEQTEQNTSSKEHISPDNSRDTTTSKKEI